MKIVLAVAVVVAMVIVVAQSRPPFNAEHRERQNGLGQDDPQVIHAPNVVHMNQQDQLDVHPVPDKPEVIPVDDNRPNLPQQGELKKIMTVRLMPLTSLY